MHFSSQALRIAKKINKFWRIFGLYQHIRWCVQNREFFLITRSCLQAHFWLQFQRILAAMK